MSMFLNYFKGIPYNKETWTKSDKSSPLLSIKHGLFIIPMDQGEVVEGNM